MTIVVVCVLVSKRKRYPLSLQRYKKVVGKLCDEEGGWTEMEDHKERIGRCMDK